MKRQVIQIDEEKCNGCGLCAKACHEGAIDMVNGKAKLVRENFCDGFGDCLPNCPTGAITFITKEAPAYDEKAVEEAKKAKHQCPGTTVKTISIQNNDSIPFKSSSKLSNWPVQIKLAPIQAPYFKDAKLLIAADCTAYAYANFHEEFIKGKVTLIGCPKLDNVNYYDKLKEILINNDIKSLTIVRMEVPCCGGLERAATQALKDSGKFIPWQVVTIGTSGNIIN